MSNKIVKKTDNDNPEEIVECQDINSYITTIKDIRNRYSNTNVVFRGELQDFGSTKCSPNVFRKEGYKVNKFYEKNILDELDAYNIANNDNYLFKAINAQHGGFPSRLLDVSFNALVALHFAVNPHYKESVAEKINEYNSKPGYVYIFFFDEMYCASSSIIQDCFNSIINKDNELLTNPYIFSQNYKLIDHIKLNERVIAQQGGFILFPGIEYHPIPKWMYKTIKIPANAKLEISNDLKNLFGIDNATMYPEAANQVDIISNRSVFINNSEFSESYEFSKFLHFVEEECNSFYDSLLKEKNFDESIVLYREFEKQLHLYKIKLDEYCNNLNRQNLSNISSKINYTIIDEVIDDSLKNIFKNLKELSDDNKNRMTKELIEILSSFSKKIKDYFKKQHKETIDVLYN